MITLNLDGTIDCKGVNGVDVVELQQRIDALIHTVDALVSTLNASGVKDANGAVLRTATELIEQEKTLNALKQ